MPRMYSKEFLTQLRGMNKLKGITKDELKKAYDQVYDDMTAHKMNLIAAHASTTRRPRGPVIDAEALNIIFDGDLSRRRMPEAPDDFFTDEDDWP